MSDREGLYIVVATHQGIIQACGNVTYLTYFPTVVLTAVAKNFSFIDDFLVWAPFSILCALNGICSKSVNSADI